jgi:hypothetical protein
MLKIIQNRKGVYFIILSNGHKNMNHPELRPIDTFNLIHQIICEHPVPRSGDVQTFI